MLANAAFSKIKSFLLGNSTVNRIPTPTQTIGTIHTPDTKVHTMESIRAIPVKIMCYTL